MFLLIIKIIGIVILAILIVAIILMLFDINYDIKLIKDDVGFRVYFDCKYMLSAVRFKAVYHKGFFYNTRIFFIKLANKKKSVKNEKIKKQVILKKPVDDNDYIFYDREELLSNQYDIKELKKDIKKNKNTDNINKDKKDGIFKRIFNIIKNKDIDTIKYLFSKLKELIKIINPNKVRGDIRYGALNPFNVGIALSILGIFDVLCDGSIKAKKEISLKPVEFDINMSGTISVIMVIRIFLQIYLNKKTRILLFG